MRQTFERIHGAVDGALRPVEFAAFVLAGAILLLTMLLVTLDAAMRYLFNAPLTFQYILTEKYLLIALICLALPWGYRIGGYIRITALADNLPRRARHMLLRLGLLVSFVYVGVLAWTSGKEFLHVYLTGQTQIGVLTGPSLFPGSGYRWDAGSWHFAFS